MVRKRKLRIDDALDIILNSDIDSDDDSSPEVIIELEQPIERPDAISDEDSDQSDDEFAGDVEHLPGRILRSAGNTDTNPTNTGDTSAPTCTLIKKKKPSEYIWSKDPAIQSITLRDTLSTSSGLDAQSPYHTFQEFFDVEMVELITRESNRYARMRGWNYPDLQKDDILLYSGVIIFSGYHQLPRRRMYWEQKEDCDVSFIVNNIRRDNFERIHKSLHFSNNSEMDDDRLFKVRPIFDIANKNFKKLPVNNVLSIDEQMLKYFGRHSAKQFIRGKPVRFNTGWLCSEESILVQSVRPSRQQPASEKAVFK